MHNLMSRKGTTVMLRKPTGKYDVSIRRMDTDFFGTPERRLSLMFFYPLIGGSYA